MAKVLGGCTKYYYATVTFPFADEPCCDICPLLETYARRQCRLTGQYLPYDKAPYGGRLLSCPLLVDEEDIRKEDANEQTDLCDG